MASSDDDRPKKSWRELDQMRDKSSHRKESGGGGRRSRTEQSAEYRAYKTQLNRLFEGGAVPDALKTKLGDATPKEVKEKKNALRAIIDAQHPRDVLALLKEFRRSFGFPEEEEALMKLLDVSDEDVVLEALQTIARLLQEGRLKRGASLKARIKTAQMTIDDPRVQEAAKSLLGSL